MTDCGKCLITALLSASAILLLPIVIWMLRGLWRVLKKIYAVINKKAKFKAPEHRHTVSKGLFFAFLLLLSITCIRYAVGYYSNYYEMKTDANPNILVQVQDPDLNYFELFPGSLLNALRTFSMDADYEESIVKGKEMICQTFGNAPGLERAYGIYCSLLSGVAPIVGGAIIFEIIAGFFPSLRLRFVRFCGFLFRWRNMKKKKWVSLRKRFYFSNLNERSLALAKDIYNNERRWLAIVFCDVNGVDENLVAQAKHIGAVCVKKDIVSTIGKSITEKTVLLMNDCENENLRALTSLLGITAKSMANIEIYVFSDDNNVSHIDDEVTFIVKQKLGKDKKKESAKLPVIIPVDSTRNMAQNLLRDLPLYEPVVNTEKDKVTVTIFGSGVIGTQLFLSTYWCGQMLGKQLHINIVSKEAECDFKGRINSINPDILRTSNQKSPLLNYDDKHRNPVYFKGLYKQEDVQTQNLAKILCDETKSGDRLIDSDYFIVALGSDEDNFAIADQLRRNVGEHHIYADEQSNTVIAYVIYNSELCAALNAKPKHKLRCPDKTDVFMWAFGCMDDVYSVRNIFFSEILAEAKNIGKIYYSLSEQRREYDAMYKDAYSLNSSKNIKRLEDAYSYKANLARSLHMKYKVFSAGYIDTSVFNTKNKTEYSQNVEKAYNDYARFAKYNIDIQNLPELHKLAWLEHRRWNAFMRVCGFRCPEGDFRKYENVTQDHKNLALKLHPCIVECNDKGINSMFDDRGVIIKESAFRNDFENEDFLDKVSVAKKAQAELIAKPKKEVNGFECYPDAVLCDDFKYWDYPMYSVEKDKAEFEHKAPEKDFKLFAALKTKAAKLEMSLYWIDNKWYMSKEKYYELVFQALENAATAKAGDGEKVDVNKLCRTLIQNLTGSENLKRGVDMIEFDEIDGLYESVLNRIDDFIVK